jgi:Cu2+-exporting ATPase
VPAATTRAVAVLAREGVLVLAPDALEKLLGVTRIVFDKTGTLTTRHMELTGTQPLRTFSAAECLALAAALEQASTHPIADALRRAAHGLPQRAATDVKSIAGAGIEGTIDGRRLRLGRAAFAWSADADDAGVLLADANGPLARFVLRESLRPEAASTLAALAQDGLALEILSGDDAAHVAAVAQRLGVETWQARCTPHGKLAQLERERARGERIAMIGDGINDAPVLAGADLSVALGGGAQLAQSSADLVLAGDRLDALVTARRVAQQTARVLRQNVIWAAAYNFLSIPLAAVGLVPPWLAAIGMSLSSLFVVLNSLRIRRPARSAENPSHDAAPLPRAPEALPA